MSHSEDPSPTLARAVLPTYLHHVMDASETLADFALRRLAGNETARRELAAQIDAQREVCAAPVSIFKGHTDSADGSSNVGPFARSEVLSPGARAAKRAADDAKLADLERALRAANAEAGEIEVRLRVAEDAAASLRGAPRELRAITRLLSDVIADLEAFKDDDDDDGGAFSPRAPRSAGSASSGRSGASASLSPGKQEAIATAAAILADAERVDPSMPLVTGARVTAVARAAADAADALLSRAQQCLEEEAKLRGLLARAREARRVNADPAKPARSPSFLPEEELERRNGSPLSGRALSFGARSPLSPTRESSSASARVGPAWSPGGRFLGSAAAARQSDATLKAQARRATQRRSLKDARTQKRVQRNLDYHIQRLEEETKRMSTEADTLEQHLKRVEANHRNAAGALDTLAWLLEHAEAFRKEAARREAERRRRRERRFAPSGASVRQPTRVSVSAGSDAFSETSLSSRGALGLPMRAAGGGSGGGSDADSRPSSSRPASRASAIERWQARARAESSLSARATPHALDSAGEEHWRDKYARQRDEIVSRESARSATLHISRDEERSGGRLPPSPAVETRSDLGRSDAGEPVDRVSLSSSRDRRPERVSPLRRRHDRLMAQGKIKKEAEAEGKTTPAARDVDDDDVTERTDGSPDGSRTEETRLGDFSTDPTSVGVATIPTMRLEDLDLPVAVPVPMATPPVNRVLDLEAPPSDLVNDVNDVIRPPPPRPETSLELIEAELAELRRLEFEATGSIPREFETLASATSLDSAPLDFRDARLDPRRTLSLPVEQKFAEKKKKPKPLPVVDLRPKPRAKPREPWGPPPAPPKTKWKRNSLDREAVAALREEKAKEKARASSPSSPGPGPEPSVSMDANVLTQTSPRSGKKKKQEASSSADANKSAPSSPRRAAAEGDFVEAAPARAPGKEKKRSVFKSAYKSLKRAAGIPSKKEKAAAKQAAKQAAREREKAAAGPGER